jgi:hypothetical protein
VAHVTKFERYIGPRKPEQTALKAEATSSLGGKRPEKRSKSEQECFKCSKKGHYKRDYKSKPKDDLLGSKDPKKSTEGSASTGPLPTPGAYQGSTQQAKTATESCWAATEQGESTLNWMIDSGCSRHMTYYKDVFVDYNRLAEPVIINTASGAQLQGIAEGSIVLHVLRNRQLELVTLTGVLHVPGLSGSLISVLQLQDKGISV